MGIKFADEKYLVHVIEAAVFLFLYAYFASFMLKAGDCSLLHFLLKLSVLNSLKLSTGFSFQRLK